MMETILKTAIVYLMLTLIIRLMGKRQLGELDITEFVITILLSEIAAAPIIAEKTSIGHAAVAMLTLLSLEVATSFLIIKLPFLKKMLSSHPTVLISRGIINIKAMKKVRISVEELICQIRQNGIFDLNEVDYAILEENGKMSIIPKSRFRQPDRCDLNIPDDDSGAMHILISDGKINDGGLILLNKDRKWLEQTVAKYSLSVKDIFCMTCNDADDIFVIKKDGTAAESSNKNQ